MYLFHSFMICSQISSYSGSSSVMCYSRCGRLVFRWYSPEFIVLKISCFLPTIKETISCILIVLGKREVHLGNERKKRRRKDQREADKKKRRRNKTGGKIRKVERRNKKWPWDIYGNYSRYLVSEEMERDANDKTGKFHKEVSLF